MLLPNIPIAGDIVKFFEWTSITYWQNCKTFDQWELPDHQESNFSFLTDTEGLDNKAKKMRVCHPFYLPSL